MIAPELYGVASTRMFSFVLCVTRLRLFGGEATVYVVCWNEGWARCLLGSRCGWLFCFVFLLRISSSVSERENRVESPCVNPRNQGFTLPYSRISPSERA